jgi:glycosyltransferase involved in cell wall biosynthesis
LGQTYGHFEAVVCDDGSSDNSREIIGEYTKKDARVKLIEQRNQGLRGAVNTAYENCQGDVLALLDADDAFEPFKLESVLDVFKKNPRSGFCVNRLLPVSGTGERIGNAPWPASPDLGWLGPAKLHQGGTADFPAASGLSFRREVARELFPIPSALTHAPDHYLSHTAQFLTEVSLAERVLTRYRIHGANMSGVSTAGTGSYGVHCDPRLLEKWVTSGEEVLTLQAALLTKLYGPRIGGALQLKDNWRYWYYLLTIRALRGRKAGAVRPFTVQEMIRHIPRRPERRVWRAITLLPDPLAKRAYLLWRGDSPLKRTMKALFLPLIRR